MIEVLPKDYSVRERRALLALQREQASWPRIALLGDNVWPISPDAMPLWLFHGKGNARFHGIPRVSWPEARQLRQQLRAGKADLLIWSTFSTQSAAWDPGHSMTTNIRNMVRRKLGDATRQGVGIIDWLMDGVDTPLVVVDSRDTPPVITARYHRLLEMSTRYFFREMPPQPELSFLGTTPRLQDNQSVRRSEWVARQLHKLRPLGLGANLEHLPECRDKKTDVFFAGSLKGQALRENGVRQLRELREEGIKVDLAENLSREEFLRRVGEAHLAWSPQGHGWECFRHNEVALCGTVPLMNYPTITRYKPYEEGHHALYYAPEGDGLKRAVRQALRNRARLVEMGAAAREHAWQHHTWPRLVDYVVRESLPGWDSDENATARQAQVDA